MSEVKFTEDEMKSINDIQKTYLGLQNALGQVGVNRIRLGQQIEDLDRNESDLRKEFVSTQTKERDFIDQINKKYGDGNLDINTGVFTPAEKETEKTS
tara:strand:- start:419 stop:712 length:294 start_codon:yes stop_codon:yes gene_type:complete